MNYFGRPHDMKVMVAVLRRALDIVAHWPAHRNIGPADGAAVRSRRSTGTSRGRPPSDALLEDLALHFALTVYHLTSTCRIGSVVDPRLRVMGVGICALPMRVSCRTCQRKHQCGVDHDWRKGSGDDRRRPRREVRRVCGRIFGHARLKSM